MDAIGGVIFILFIIGGAVFWIWSLVDCLKSEWKNPSDKVVWLLVILFLNLFGSILYVLISPSKKMKSSDQTQET